MTGIPVSVVLNKFDGRSENEDKHKFHDAQMPKEPGRNPLAYEMGPEKKIESELTGPPADPGPDTLASEGDYFKSIEKEFADQAESILDGLQLSHLRMKAKKKPADRL